MMNDFEYDEEQDRIYLDPEIEKSLAKEFVGRDMIVIRDAGEMVKRFKETLKEDRIDRMYGPVTYYDEFNDPHPLSEEEFEADPPRALMYKGNFFENQKEFRITLKDKFKDDKFINIGDIRDIALNVGRIKSEDMLPLKVSYQEKE